MSTLFYMEDLLADEEQSLLVVVAALQAEVAARSATIQELESRRTQLQLASASVAPVFQHEYARRCLEAGCQKR